MKTFRASDPKLAAAAIAGDSAAFSQLIRHNEGRVYAVCLRITRSPELAQEAAQDAFLSGWKAIGGFREDASFDSWIYRIAINAALRVVRRRPDTVDTPVEDLLPKYAANGHPAAEFPQWRAGPDRKLWLKQVREAIDNALPVLDEKYRAPYVLREFEDMPVAQIAETLGLSVPAVKTRVHRARLMLRKLIEPRFGETSSNKEDSNANQA